MRRRSFAIALVAGSVLAAPAAAQASLQAFRSPTGNITCVISTESGGFAQCELRNVPRGGGFMVPRSGRVSRYDVASEDDLAGRRFTLAYGRSTQLGGFRCTSQFAAMRCVSLGSGHGFRISRQRQQTF